MIESMIQSRMIQSRMIESMIQTRMIQSRMIQIRTTGDLGFLQGLGSLTTLYHFVIILHFHRVCILLSQRRRYALSVEGSPCTQRMEFKEVKKRLQSA